MRKRFLIPSLLIAALIAVLLATACTTAAAPEETQPPTEEAFSVTLTDALGSEITLSKKPARIISLTLGTDEILLDLVGPERLTGVSYLAPTPEVSNIADNRALAEVENLVEANPEQIIALEPDLVLIASFTDPAVIEQLKGAGLNVFAVGSFVSIEAMQENILTLGTLVGETEKAQQMVEGMNDRLAAIEAKLSEAEGEPPRVLYLSSDGWVAGSATTVDDIIQRAGGANAAAEAGLNDWNQVSEEAIIEMNPDVVILSPFVTDEEFRTNPVFAELSAVQNGRVYAPSDKVMSATSQYIVLGVEELAQLLHPDLFAGE